MTGSMRDPYTQRVVAFLIGLIQVDELISCNLNNCHTQLLSETHLYIITNPITFVIFSIWSYFHFMWNQNRLLKGAGGPGGVLGILPAVEMNNWVSTTAYLASFVFTSTLTMSLFAAFYGEVTKRIASAWDTDFYLRILSYSLSMIVGSAWLVLSFFGTLDTVFA